MSNTCSEWVTVVVGVFLGLPWSSRRTAASPLSSLITHNPDWTHTILSTLESAVARSEFNPRAVMEALQCLATPTHPEREALALDVLLICHHPQICESENWF